MLIEKFLCIIKSESLKLYIKGYLHLKKAILGNLYTNFEEVTIEKILRRFLHL